MRRRSFLAGLATAAAGLVLPYEPRRIYSFPTPKLTVLSYDELYYPWDGANPDTSMSYTAAMDGRANIEAHDLGEVFAWVKRQQGVITT